MPDITAVVTPEALTISTLLLPEEVEAVCEPWPSPSRGDMYSCA